MPPEKPVAQADITELTNKGVTVTATFSEDSAQKQYSLDGQTWSDYASGVVMNGNGTVYFRGIDEAGNVSEVASYEVANIDKIAPTVPTVAADVTTPTNGNVTVAAKFGDDSVVKEYSLDNKTWQNYTSAVVFAANGTIYFRGIDAVGNISEAASYTVTNIDKVAPSAPTAVADITAPTNKNVTVTAVFCEDSERKQYRLENQLWQTYTSGIVFPKNGTVYFRGIDAAGNVSDVTSYAVTNIDKVAPSAPTANADITVVTNKNVTVTATFSNDTATKQYRLENQLWQPYTSGIVFSKNGTVYFRSIDAAGNVSDMASYAVTNIAHGRVGLFSGNMTSAALVSTTDVMTDKSLDKTNDLMFVYIGGTANSTTVNSGGSMLVSRGGTANSTIVNSGGTVCVSSGGTANNIVWQKGGKLTVESSAFLNIINVGDKNILTVSEGAVVNSVTVSSDGKVEVNSGGTANFVNIASSGALMIKSGGTATEVYVSRYAELNAAPGAIVSGLYILSRGGIHEYIIPGNSTGPESTWTSDVTSTSTGVVAYGGLFYDVHLHSSALLSCFDDTTISGGEVNSNAILYMDSGVVASGITVNKIGTLYVSNGGVAYDTRLTSDGIMTVIGEARGITASGGSIYLGDPAFSGYDGTGGLPTSNEYDEDIHASATVLNSSWMHVYYGASTTDTEVNSNSWLHVYYGGSVTMTEINSSGYLTVQDSGTADTVYLHSGGFVRLYTGAIVKGNVNVGGEVTVWKAGTSATEDVIRAYGANVNFMLNERTASDAAVIDNLGMIMGATYFVTVSATQQSGSYKLAEGAKDFTGSVTVKNAEGISLGTISVNGSCVNGGYSYSLVKDSGTLTFTVDGAAIEVLATVAGEFTGNGGVFRLMADGSGAVRTAEAVTALAGSIDVSKWELAAVGDFNGDGKDGLLWVEKSTGYAYMQYDMTSFAEVNNKNNCLGVVGEGYSIKAAGDFSKSGIDGVLMQGPAFGDPAISLNYGLPVWARDKTGATYAGWLGALVNTWQPGDTLKGDLSDPVSINANNYMYEVVGVGDFDGDGRDDVMLQNTMPKTVNGKTITGSGDVFTFLTGDEAAIKAGAAPTVCYAGCATDGWSVVGFGDFDGNGTDDALLSDGTGLAGWKMANGQRGENFWFGNLPSGYEISGVADVDSDGTDDIILADANDQFSAWKVVNGVVTGAIAIK